MQKISHETHENRMKEILSFRFVGFVGKLPKFFSRLGETING